MTNDIESPSTPKKATRSQEKIAQSLEISPTLTTATSFSPQESPRTITIDHQVSTSARGNGTRGLILGMSKPIFAIIAATVLATSGSAAWLFSEWLAIPGLKEQISALSTEVTKLEAQVLRLETQVDRLSTEVDELAHENDRYTMLNAQLNQTAEEYEILNAQLNASTLYLANLNQELNHSNLVYSELNAQLANENTQFASLNSELNATHQELAAINEDLFTVVNFLNNTSSNLQRNLEAIVDFLAEQIAVNRFLVLETLKNTYLQRIQNWDCGLARFFSTQDFAQNGNAPVDSTLLPEVLDYVDTHLLSGLCLDKVNLEDYLIVGVAGQDPILTSNELIQGVSRYVGLAMSYYFEEEADGISPEEWAQASYQCSNLVQPFRWIQ